MIDQLVQTEKIERMDQSVSVICNQSSAFTQTDLVEEAPP